MSRTINLGRVTGKSAYEVWLDLGNIGTEQDFINSLQGQAGYTPQRGTDYWTSSDIATIETYCANYIDSHITDAIGGEY